MIDPGLLLIGDGGSGFLISFSAMVSKLGLTAPLFGRTKAGSSCGGNDSLRDEEVVAQAYKRGELFSEEPLEQTPLCH